jgi:hypothetical protein
VTGYKKLKHIGYVVNVISVHVVMLMESFVVICFTAICILM